MFVDGRHCRIPRQLGHPYLCAFHARKDAQALAGEAAGKDIAYHLSGSFVSACDLTSALGRLFSAVAQGHVKPKTASTLAYLGQTMVQALPLARDEYINAYDTDDWRETIRESHEQSANHTSPDAESPTVEPAPVSSSQPAPASSPQPAPAPQSQRAPSQPSRQTASATPPRVSPESRRNLCRPSRQPGSSSAAASPASQPTTAPTPSPSAAQPAAPTSPQSHPAPPVPPSDTIRMTGKLRDPELPPCSQSRSPRTAPSTPHRPSSAAPILPGTAFR